MLDVLTPEQARVYENLARFPQLRLFPVDEVAPRRPSSIERAIERLERLS